MFSYVDAFMDQNARLRSTESMGIDKKAVPCIMSMNVAIIIIYCDNLRSDFNWEEVQRSYECDNIIEMRRTAGRAAKSLFQSDQSSLCRPARSHCEQRQPVFLQKGETPCKRRNPLVERKVLQTILLTKSINTEKPLQNVFFHLASQCQIHLQRRVVR